MTYDRFSDGVFEFVGPRGYILAGRIERPETTPQAWAMLVHDGMAGDIAARTSSALVAQGIGVVSFDFAPDADDLVAAAAAMSASWREPALLVVFGDAGATVARVARAIPSVRAVAAIAAPDGFAPMLLRLGAAVFARRAVLKSAAATVGAWASRHLASAGGPRSGAPGGLAGAA